MARAANRRLLGYFRRLLPPRTRNVTSAWAGDQATGSRSSDSSRDCLSLRALSPLAAPGRTVSSDLHALEGVAELLDVDLRHLEHRLGRPLRGLANRALHVLDELSRDDLPRQAEAVLQPAADAGLSPAGDEGVPVLVDLSLILAVDRERDRFVELEVGTAVESDERLAGDGEVDCQNNAGRPARRVRRRPVDLVDPAVREERRVELRRLLSLAVKPQARSDPAGHHKFLLSSNQA